MDPKKIEHLKLNLDTPIEDLRKDGYVSLANYIGAGFKADKLKAAGFVLDDTTYDIFEKLGRRKELIAAGFNEYDFLQIGEGITAKHFMGAGLTCRHLLQVGWSAAALKEPDCYGEEAVKATLKQICDEIRTPSHQRDATPLVPIRLLKAAGFSVEEMKEAGFTAQQLKSGAWNTPQEIAYVDDVFGVEGILRELKALKGTQSVPITYEHLKVAKNDYLRAVEALLGFRDDRRKLKKQVRQLQRRIKKASEWKDNVPGKEQAKEQLAADKEALDDLTKRRKDAENEVKGKRKLLVDVIDGRVGHLKDQIEFFEKVLFPIRTDIRGKIEELNSARHKISYKNAHLVRDNYPLTRINPYSRRQAVKAIAFELGRPEKVEFSKLKHPSEEIDSSDPKRERWVSAEEAKYKKKPLEHLAFLEAKKEKAEWILSDLEAEIELLESVKEVIQNAKSLWRTVASKSAYHTLLGLARYTTTEVGFPSLLPTKKADLSPIRWRRITGKIDFNLSFGISAGVGSGAVASAKVGLSVSLSGSLAVDDDRRVRARLSIKLIPNLEVNFHPGGSSVAKATAKFGFTITNQAMAFVDEKHFAHYVMFRIANIRNFHEKLMEYGARGLDYEYDPYSETVKKIAAEELGAQTTAAFEAEQRYYLTQKPVVKAHMPVAGKIRPTVDLGAESEVIGLDGGVSIQLKTPMYFQKEVLALPSTDSKKAPADLGYKGARYWEYKAHEDRECAYSSIAFLLKQHELTPNLLTARDLRRTAARWIRRLYADKQDGSHPVWRIDKSLYKDYKDYLHCIDTSIHHTKNRHYADLQVIAALAEAYECTILVHQIGHDVIVLPPNPKPNVPVLHLAFRVDPEKKHADQYNALIKRREETDPPAIPATDLPPKMKLDGDRPIYFDEMGTFHMEERDFVWRLDKRKPRTASSVMASKKELRRKYTPRIITLGRLGNSWSVGGKVNFKSWVSIGLEAGICGINHHINPDNDGSYLNIKTKGSLLQRSFAAPADPPKPPSPTDPMERGDLGGEVWEQFVPPDNLGLDNLAKALGPVKLDIELFSRYMEWNYVHEGGAYRRQYRKHAYTSGFSVGVDGEVDVYPGVVAGLAFSVGISKAVVLSESLGTDTLSYLITVFNGLRLRRNGMKQWYAYLKKHDTTLRCLYRRIGKAHEKDTGSNDDKLPNAYKAARNLQVLVKDNKPVWENHDEDPDWSRARQPDEDDKCQFLKCCKQKKDELKRSRRERVKESLLPRYKNSPACMEELNHRFTTLLWRSSKVKTLYDERMNPFKRKIRYLIPPKGHIRFKARLEDSGLGLEILEAPAIQAPKTKEEYEWMRYKRAADIWMNPTLREAEDAVEFFRAGFAITLKLKLPNSKQTLLVQPSDTVAANNDKDNDDLVREFFMKLAKEAVDKRKGNLQDFATLVKLDPLMEQIFSKWILHLGGDVYVRHRFRRNEVWKAKDHYPIDAEGMELMPSGSSLLTLDQDEMPRRALPADARDDPEHGAIDVAALPGFAAKYNAKQANKQKGLEEREKWVQKANLLWDEWVTRKERELEQQTGGAVNAVELVLGKIQGPFPGFWDDNYQLLIDQQGHQPR